MIGNPRKLSRPRGFAYEPRYYNPDVEEKKKRRLRFAAPSDKRQRKTRQPAFVMVALGLVVAFYLYANLETITERVVSFGSFFFGG